MLQKFVQNLVTMAQIYRGLCMLTCGEFSTDLQLLVQNV